MESKEDYVYKFGGEYLLLKEVGLQPCNDLDIQALVSRKYLPIARRK